MIVKDGMSRPIPKSKNLPFCLPNISWQISSRAEPSALIFVQNLRVRQAPDGRMDADGWTRTDGMDLAKSGASSGAARAFHGFARARGFAR